MHSSPLLRFASNETSQNGEDGILLELFSSLLLDYSTTTATKTRSTCVDVGSWDGKHLSNTYTLITKQGWGGVLFEANEERSAAAHEMYEKQGRTGRLVSEGGVKCVSALVGCSSSSSKDDDDDLSRLLQQHAPDLPSDFDLLSIDVDGCDYHIMHSLLLPPPSEQQQQDWYRPKVICIEFNPTIGNAVSFIQPKDVHVQQGSSLRALRDLAEKCSYSLICTTTFNALFLRHDLVPFLQANLSARGLPLVPMPSDLHLCQLDQMHCSSMITHLFQTYDGELKFVGPKKVRKVR